ncbi:MAG TPA: ABC transporter ATP-binding protein [Candidatus Evtepia faecavium]|nr:ABC transporter ATP-binding protein [Candidatus Evtepia faecavium]
MEENILEIRHLTKDYGAFRLEDVSFSLPRGVIMGLIGENGAGKSTTINCILGEVEKTSGEIALFGQDQAAWERENKGRIGVVFDENHFPDLFTPRELGQVMAGVYPRWDGGTYRQFLTRFSLSEDQKIKDFSKGMKVKLAFAVALSHGAELLILDEATSGLDPIVRDEVLDLLLDFVQDERHAVLVSSHITSDLEKVADYITFLHQGKLVFTLEKDLLVDQYGVLHCGAAVFDTLDPADILAWRREAYQYKVLVRDRYQAEKKYPQALVSPAAIEDTMLFYVKGEVS